MYKHLLLVARGLNKHTMENSKSKEVQPSITFVFLIVGLVVLGVYSASTISDLKRKISNQEWIIDDYEKKISELNKIIEEYKNDHKDRVEKFKNINTKIKNNDQLKKYQKYIEDYLNTTIYKPIEEPKTTNIFWEYVINLINDIEQDLDKAIFYLSIDEKKSFNKYKKNIILNIDNLIRFCGNNDQYLTDSEKELLNLIKNNLKSPKKNSVETLTKLKKELFCWK